MKKLALLAVAVLAGVICASAPSYAVTASLYDPGNSGMGSFAFVESGTDLYFTEEWTAAKRGFILIDGLQAGVDYVVHKRIINNTGVDWTFFSNELLDPYDGPGSNDDIDPQPYPGWVPAGFSTSNDFDGLSFAQGSPIPKTSTSFFDVFVDELSDARDFVEFFNGFVSGAGGAEVQSFGLRDNAGNNEPFLLAQRPNEHSLVPEPGTLMLLGSGLLSLGLFRRKK